MIHYAVIFVLAFFQSSFLSPLFAPGFLSPDLVFIFLFTYSFKERKDIIFKAFFGGFVLDVLHDSLGLFMSANLLSAYLMFMFYERILVKRLFFVLGSLAFFTLLNYSVKIALMSRKFSFELNPFVLSLSLFITLTLGLLGYLLFAGGRDEQA